jgi:predicted metal-dependent hydrolase
LPIPRIRNPERGARILAALRRLAATELPARVHELAALHGIRVSRVSVRNQRTRWGSCSTAGLISLNWKLVQTPESVRDYVILHELAHRRHPDHSARFWAEVEWLCPGFEEAETWLRTEGRHCL